MTHSDADYEYLWGYATPDKRGRVSGGIFSGVARDPARIDDILGLLRELWMQSPDQRLGQLIYNVTPSLQGLFNLEDTDMRRAIKTEIDRNYERGAPRSSTDEQEASTLPDAGSNPVAETE